MTVINLRGLHTALGVPAVTSGVVLVEYWAGSGPVARVDGANVVLPALITAAIVEGDPGTLDLPPTAGVCCVRWTVQSDVSRVAVVRFTEIPASGPVDFGALQQVDPATFVPTADVVAAWEAVVADVVASAGAAAVSAQAAQDAAAPVTAAAESINAGLNVTDGAFAAVLANPASASSTELSAAFVGLKQAAKNPDLLIVGNITRDSNQAVTSADVVWPDGTPGTFTADTLSTAFPGAVDAYHITYGSPVTKTFTQPAITRNSAGAATTVPQIVVS